MRFGGSLNAHCHVHSAWVDGVFSLDPNTSKPRFHFIAPPTPQDVQRVAATVAVRVNRMLRRKGLCKYPTRGKTHRVMRPLELMARLAAIVPPPRFPLWRYHGVLAPGAPWRKLIVPASA